MAVDAMAMGVEFVSEWAWLGVAGIAFLVVLVIGGIVFYQWKRGVWFANYPVDIRIWENRAGHFLFTGHDRARAIQLKTGEWEYELKSTKLKLQPFSLEFINPNQSLDLLRLNRDEYHPLKIMADTYIKIDEKGKRTELPILKLQPVVDEIFKHVFVTRTHKNYERNPTQSWFTQWGGAISIALVGIFVLLIVVVVLKDLGPIVEHVSRAAQTLGEAANACKVCTVPVEAIPMPP